MRRIKRIARLAKLPILVFFCIVFAPVLFALVGVGVECRVFGGNPSGTSEVEHPEDSSAAARQITAELSNYARREDQTYLTLPEWYIVYSSDEYADFIAQSRPSRFPYFRAIGQYWRSYYDVCAITREQYPFNAGYHLTLTTIGTSFTIENILKGMYENTIGRLTEWISSRELTEEDAYARQVAEEYGTFIHTIPWYEFPFGDRLQGLWEETHLFGPNIIRKWERKIVLSLEYGTKSIYGRLIKLGTKTVFSDADLKIYIWAEGFSEQMLRQEPDIRLVKIINAQSSIVELPRYEAFTQIMPRLAKQGVQFKEIAGNDEILITMIAPRAQEYDLKDGTFLFEMPILTQPDNKRVAVKVPVQSLHLVLTNLDGRAIQLEHMYDY